MTKRIHIITLALDASPFLSIQLSNFNRIDTSLVDWTWHIVHGAAANTGSTSWCQPQQPRLSRDGTTELLTTWQGHPRIRIYQRQLWEGGKDAMINEALRNITEPCLLLEADADEFWLPDQLATMVVFFNAYDQIRSARFFCRYYVGPNIVITSTHSYGNRPGEWHRAWVFTPGDRAIRHEPPVMSCASEPCATREQTKEAGLVFDHWAYALEKSLAYKEHFYGYKNAVAHWRRLQSNTIWPVTDLRQFLPWVDSGVTADLLHKP